MSRSTVTITRTPDGGVTHDRWSDPPTTYDPTDPPLVLRADSGYVVCACLAIGAILLLAVWVVS